MKMRYWEFKIGNPRFYNWILKVCTPTGWGRHDTLMYCRRNNFINDKDLNDIYYDRSEDKSSKTTGYKTFLPFK